MCVGCGCSASRIARHRGVHVTWPREHSSCPRSSLRLLDCSRPGGKHHRKVVCITDGDTLTFLKSAKEQVEVRLHGINAPASKQAFALRGGTSTTRRKTQDLANVETVY